jgi:uncharacterized RDD family membrane protein YckC
MEEILDSPDALQVQLNYAGFWIRFAAALIDGVILIVLRGALILLMGGSFLQPSAAVSILAIVVQLLYFVLMESSAKQATIGKMAVGIKVGDEFGNRISPARALGRYLGKIVSFLILFIGYMMAGWDEKKQALHDKMASTYVFYATPNA